MKKLSLFAIVCCLGLISSSGVEASDKIQKAITKPIINARPTVHAGPGQADLIPVEINMGDPVPLRIGLAKHTVMVDSLGNRIANPTAVVDGKLVYSNNLGNAVFGPAGILATTRLADDLGTIAMPGCTLDRYVIRITGDRSGTGIGVGDYTVKTALHSICPSVKPEGIPGTEAVVTIRIGVDVTTAADLVELVVLVRPHVDIADVRYISLQFSRDHCGVIVGAPANVGFSGDRFDFPISACSANFGGYPGSPHGSFGVDLYVREEACPDAHLAYRNSNHAGSFFTTGVNRVFAEPVRIGVPFCNLIGYEFAYQGEGGIRVDLRRRLINTDPISGDVIPGSRANFFSSALDGVLVGRHLLAEPFQLTNSNLFVGFLTTTTSIGPLLTCNSATLGVSYDLYFVHDGTEWVTTNTPDGCLGSFDVTLICEDLPPIGACCDMILVDDQNESVCRDGIPKMNCPFPELWQQGKQCNGICVGGNNDGAACTRHADCDGGDCDGPFFDSCGLSACCKPRDAYPAGCENLTHNECDAIEPLENARMYERGSFCARGAQRCPRPGCIDGSGDCFSANAHCVGGLNHGQLCDFSGFPTLCNAPACHGGSRDGLTCVLNADDCPNGVCERGHCLSTTGCEDFFCCSGVCAQDPYCCEISWDIICAGLASQTCKPSDSDKTIMPDD